ncbi:hypothetical protein B0H21DRAFT_695974 [Amylocystis lapponica]|nr:hypothetical protein B0H21DRAFT_695974 [Amylocystis lapponica]
MSPHSSSPERDSPSYSPDPSPRSKREYLLAQIRQKDVIIEKLLREQLHSPYTATPMSIASYRLNTSPSDRTKQTVVDWLDRMQSSVESSNRLRTGETFRFESRAHAGGDSDEEAEGVLHNDATERGSVADPLGAADDSRDAAEQLPDAAVPIGLLAKMSLYNNTTKERKKEKTLAGDGESDDGDVGVASPDYFMPGPVHDLAMRANLIQDHSPPEILVYGLVTPDDVEGLFKIYYERLNVHVTLLDAEVHTPANTFARCPFLFTVICAVASRYYPPKSEIYPVAMHFAKRAAAEGLLNGWKSVELAQAYILLSIYAVPARRWEDDRSWLYTGLAIRIATDLNLHHASTIQPKSKEHAREIVNKTRLWINCYNLDRSMATQFGKPSTIKEDYTIRKSDDWYKRSPMNHPNDVGLCAYTQLLRIMASFHEEIYSDPSAPTGLNRALDFRAVTLRHDEQMTRYFDDWTRRFNEDPSVHDAAYKFRASLLPFLTSYSRLVMYSFGFQQAFHRGMQEGDNLFLDKCFQAAKTVILCMVESLCPSGFMRYSPDGHFIFASFASAFLLKLMRPEFARLITKEQEAEIFDLIGRLIKILSSPDVAIDERHTPKLHARFLAGLLARHRRDVATSGRIHPQHPPQAQMPHGGSPAGTGVYPSQSPSSSSSSPSQQVFPSPSSQHSFVDAHGVTGTHSASENMMSMEPIYQEEHAYAAGTSPLETFNFGTSGGNMEPEMLGALLALQNPSYWKDMMMPGFGWPESPPTMQDSTLFV